MVIHIKGVGTMKRYFGEDGREVEMPAGATLQDLMYVIDTNWGGTLSPQFWDADKKQFRGVIIAIDNTPIREPNTVLQDNQEVLFFKVVAGG